MFWESAAQSTHTDRPGLTARGLGCHDVIETGNGTDSFATSPDPVGGR
jgi:hypothetical protein